MSHFNKKLHLKMNVYMKCVLQHKILKTCTLNKMLFKNFITSINRTIHPNRTKHVKVFVINSPIKVSVRHKSPVTFSMKQEIWNLIKTAKHEKLKITGAVVLLLISSTVTMSVPYFLGKIIDMLKLPVEDLKSSLTSFCKLLIILFAIGALANFGRVYLINLSSYSITNRLRKNAYNAILSQEIAFFDKAKTGELINRIVSDTSVVGSSVTNNLSDGLRSVFSFLSGSALMVYTCPKLALIGLLTVSPVSIIAMIYGRHLKQVTKSVQDSLAEATQVADEKISNIRIVQAFSQVEREIILYSKKIDHMFQFASKESLRRAVFFGLTGFSGNLITLAVLYSGGLMMTDNLITIGGLSSFLMYAAYVGISIGAFSSFYAELMKGLGASTRLWEIMDRQPLISSKSGIILPKLLGNIEFSNVDFSYPSRPDLPILSKINLSIPAGTIYAVVGPSGSGKSTLASLLLRFYDCSSGLVSIDGHDIKTLNAEWIRENIGLVSQEPVLFSCSIRENVSYGALKSVSNIDIEKSLKEANAWEFVNTFPEGLDTTVGERGIMLSGGQRQRIAIARALLKNPRILLLDEATSALDAYSENLVQSALEKLMKGRTVIMIAHRLSTIRKADVIGVLDHGKVVEEGSYDELLQKQNFFYRLVQLQTIKS